MKRRAVHAIGESDQDATGQAQGRRMRFLRISVSDITGSMIRSRLEQDEDLAALAASIASHGLLQPVLVRPIAQTGRYALISGARRVAACRLLGVKEVDALLLETDEAEAAACFLEEHVTRISPHVLDHARMVRRVGVQRVLARFSLGQFRLQRLLRLLDLPDQVHHIMQRGGLSLEQAEPLLDIADPARTLEAAQIIAERSLTPAQARRLVSGPQMQGVERRMETQSRGRRRMLRFAMEEIAAAAEQIRRRGADASVAVYSREGGMCIQILIHHGEINAARQEIEAESRNGK